MNTIYQQSYGHVKDKAVLMSSLEAAGVATARAMGFSSKDAVTGETGVIYYIHVCV